MSLDLLLWSIPGLIVLILRNSARSQYPLSQKSTWEYVVELVPFSLICFITAECILKLLFIRFTSAYEQWRMWWATIVPYPNSFKLLIAVISSFFIAKVIPLLSRLMLWYANQLNFLSEDTDNLPKNSLIFVTLKNNKVYVGYVAGAGSDESLGNRFLRLAPLMSGFRDEEHRVVYNTLYSEGAYLASVIRINVSEIVTVGKFDWDVHDEFVKKKSTILKFSKQKYAK